MAIAAPALAAGSRYLVLDIRFAQRLIDCELVGGPECTRPAFRGPEAYLPGIKGIK